MSLCLVSRKGVIKAEAGLGWAEAEVGAGAEVEMIP